MHHIIMNLIGFIYVVIAGIGFGFLGIFGRLAFKSGLSVEVLLSLRFIVAALILFLYIFVKNKKQLFLTRKQILISLALGALGYASFSTLYFMSLEGLSAALASLLLFTFPIWVNLINIIFFKEKLDFKHFISLFTACAGLIMVVWGPVFFGSMSYIFYALIAAIGYAFYVIISEKAQKNIPAISSSLYVIIGAALMLTFLGAIQQKITFQSFGLVNQQQWMYILALSLVCTIFPIIFFLLGLQRISSSKASIIVMIEPVVAALGGWIILNEKLSTLQIAGVLLVLIALYLNQKPQKTQI